MNPAKKSPEQAVVRYIWGGSQIKGLERGCGAYDESLTKSLSWFDDLIRLEHEIENEDEHPAERRLD